MLSEKKVGGEDNFSKFKYGGDMRCCLLRGRSRSDAGPAKARISYIFIERAKGNSDWPDWNTWWTVGGDMRRFLETVKFMEYSITWILKME